MKRSGCFVLALMLLLGIGLTACSDSQAPSDYYENDLHSGYPGPAPKSYKDG